MCSISYLTTKISWRPQCIITFNFCHCYIYLLVVYFTFNILLFIIIICSSIFCYNNFILICVYMLSYDMSSQLLLLALKAMPSHDQLTPTSALTWWLLTNPRTGGPAFCSSMRAPAKAKDHSSALTWGLLPRLRTSHLLLHEGSCQG